MFLTLGPQQHNNKKRLTKQVIRVAVAASQVGSYAAPPPAVTFDTNQELLWLGNEQVMMCFYLRLGTGTWADYLWVRRDE